MAVVLKQAGIIRSAFLFQGNAAIELTRWTQFQERVPLAADEFTSRLRFDRATTWMKVAQALDRARQERSSLPESITVDNGSEFCSRALEAWAMGNAVCFVRPGQPVENGFIESFNGQLRDE